MIAIFARWAVSRFIKIIIYVVILASCSNGRGGKGGISAKESVLSAAGFRESLVARTSVFGGYIPKANRLSIVTSANSQEVYAKRVQDPDIHWGMGVASFSGIALMAGANLTIHSGESSKRFDLATTGDFSAEAVQVDPVVPAFAFPSPKSTGGSGEVEVIRYLGSGNWQQSTLVFAEAGGDFLMQWSSGGKSLALLDQNTRAFRVFTAASSTVHISETTRACGAAVPSPTTTVTAMVSDIENDEVIVGQSDGVVRYRMGFLGACVDYSSWPSLEVGGGRSVIGLRCDTDGLHCYTALKDGGVKVLERTSKAAPWTVSSATNSFCLFPLSVARLSGSQGDFLCLCADGGEQKTGGKLYSTGMSLQVIDGKTGAERKLIALSSDVVALSYDEDLRRINVLQNNGLGRVDWWSLDGQGTGVDGSYVGLFVKDLF